MLSSQMEKLRLREGAHSGEPGSSPHSCIGSSQRGHRGEGQPPRKPRFLIPPLCRAGSAWTMCPSACALPTLLSVLQRPRECRWILASSSPKPLPTPEAGCRWPRVTCPLTGLPWGHLPNTDPDMTLCGCLKPPGPARALLQPLSPTPTPPAQVGFQRHSPSFPKSSTPRAA